MRGYVVAVVITTIAFFFPGALPASQASLQISEVLYHPDSPTPAEITATDIPPPESVPKEKPAAGPLPLPEPADGEIPEIRQLQEAQEKTGPAE